MRNKCRHKEAVKLVESAYILNLKWMWCPTCGATRLDRTNYWNKWFPDKTTWTNGKWKSPNIALQKLK
jgi:hypothetical protein